MAPILRIQVVVDDELLGIIDDMSSRLQRMNGGPAPSRSKLMRDLAWLGVRAMYDRIAHLESMATPVFQAPRKKKGPPRR